MTETRSYDADGRLVVDDYFYAANSWEKDLYINADVGYQNLNISGWLQSATINSYDADGRLTATSSYGRDNEDWVSDWKKIYDLYTLTNQQEEDPTSTGYGMTRLQSQVLHSDASNAAGYDAEGNATVYRAVNNETGVIDTYTVSYLKKDGYLEQTTAGTSSDPNQVATTDTSDYDAFGRRVDIVSHSANAQIPDSVRAFAYDADGQILEKREGSPDSTGTNITPMNSTAVEHYAYVSGQPISSVDEGGNINVLGGLTAFSNSDAGTSSYVVQAGDTLQTIARTVYGDENLWYVVADANSLASDGSDLTAGQSLKLPQVKTESNTASTFKPYNPNEIQGSTTPALPQAPQPPPSAQHCSTLAMIVVIAVVVVASIFTAGVAAEAMGATADSVWAAGTAAMTGASSAGIGVSMAAAAIGGAVGNAAGQLVGDAEGIHQGFSWGEVAGAGLGAGITAGLSGVVSGGEEIKTLASEGGFANDARIAGIGASSVIGNYAGEKLAGQPAHFSWANVAAAAISTEITAQMHLPTTLEQKFGQAASGEFGANLLGGLVNGAIDSETARLLGGDAQNGRQIVEDAFGNALGNAAIGEIEQQNARTEAQQQTSSDETPVWLRADSGTQGNSALAYLNGPFASQTDGMLAGYNPFNGALLASSNDYATFTGVYGLQGSTAASALDSSGHIPGQPYIGYLGPNGEFVSPPDGDVYLQSAYDHNADGTDATQDGVPLSDSPTLVVSATPAEVAAAKQGDIYGGLSDLQLEMMSTDPSSTRYAELKRQWYAQQYVRDFNNNEYPTAAMGRIVEEENFDRTNQEVAEFGRPLPQMKAYDPNAQAAFGNQIGAILGAPFVTIAAGMSYRGGASEQQVEASEEWAFGTQLMLSGERVPETRSEFEALESEDLTSAAPVNPDIIAAQQSQTSAGYNPDVWSTASLPKGSLVYGGLPGQSEYYTTLHSILDSSFGRENLFQGLQVAEDPDRGYRPEVGIYEVLNDIQVPAGQALANPSLGKGGSSQYFIRNYQQQLKLVGRIPLGQ